MELIDKQKLLETLESKRLGYIEADEDYAADMLEMVVDEIESGTFDDHSAKEEIEDHASEIESLQLQQLAELGRLAKRLEQAEQERDRLRTQLEVAEQAAEIVSAKADARVMRAEQERNALLEGLKWYADEQYGNVRFFPPIPDIPILHDCGQRARSIISKIEGK